MNYNEKLLQCAKNPPKELRKLSMVGSFNGFYEDFKNYSKGLEISSKTMDMMDHIKKINKEDIIIFDWDDEENIKIEGDLIIPFNKMFLSNFYSSYNKKENEVYSTCGILIEKTSTFLQISYFWNKTTKEEFGLHRVLINKNKLSFNDGKWNMEYLKDISLISIPVDNILEILTKICNSLTNIINALNKNNYPSYKKYTSKGIIKKEIIYESKVRSHRRHFSKDSGKFKIPYMAEEELKEKGYGISEIYVRGGKIQQNIPYTIIGSFEQRKSLLKENRRISLIKGRIWKSEAKLGLILNEIFPKEYIKNHDRRRLKGLELDFYIHELKLAFEYDGEQHFDRKLCEEVFKSDFDAQVRRDREKDRRCRKLGIKLIRIKYDEPLTKTHIKKRINFK